MPKPIVSIFVHCYPPAKGGAEFLSQQIKKALSKNYQVHVFTGKGLSLDSYKNFSHITDLNQKNIHRLPIQKFRQTIYNKLLNKFIFKFSVFSPFFFGPNLDYNQKVKKIIQSSRLLIGMAMPTKSFTDASHFSQKYSKKLLLIPCYHNVVYYNHCPPFQQAFKQANQIIYLTNFEKDQLTQNYQIDKTKLTSLVFSPIKRITRPRSGQIKKHLRQKVIRLGCIGQITTRKNLIFFKHYFDKYLNYWQQADYKISLLLAGAKTSSSTEVEKQLVKYKKIIKIQYDFTQSQKKHIYQLIDFFVSPSVEESLSIVGFEAIENHSILFIRQNSAFSQFIKNNQFSTIDDFHQQLSHIINTPKTINNIFSDQRSVAKKFNYQNFQKKIVKLTNNLIPHDQKTD